MYSDSDSLSYNSLSRSSSLIQFESLERQLLQNDGFQQQQQSFSGSTPILGGSSSGASESSTLVGSNSAGLSEFERMLCRKNTNNLLQNINGSSGRQVSVIPGVVVVGADEDDRNEDDRQISDSSDNSDSSGVDESTNSSFSSEESYYLNHSSDKNSEDDEELNEEEEIIKVGNRNIGVVSISSSGSSLKTQGCVNGNVIAFSRRFSGSTDNTNNASGSVNRNIVSGSSSNNNVRNKNSVESLSEDSGFCDQSISNSLRRVKSKSNPSLVLLDNGHFSVNATPLNESPFLNDDDICCKSMEDLSNNCTTTRSMETRSKNNNRGTTTTKIVESRRTDSKNNSQNSVSERRHATTTQRKIIIVNSQQEKISRQKRVKSSSSPELRSSANKTKKNNFSFQSDENLDDRDDLFHVSSVPNNLNLCGGPGSISSASYNNSYNKISSDSIATHNLNLFHLNSPISSTPSVITINPCLTASYANLTLLNYSDEPMATGSNSSSDLLSNRKYATGGPDTAKSEFSSLLDEITAHFDRNLSILNDQQESYEPSIR